MRTMDAPIRDLEQAMEIVAGAILPPWRDGDDDLKVGLEPELFPVRVGPGGEPLARLPIHGPGGSLERFERLPEAPWRRAEREDDLPELLLADGGRITFEPGGQVEHSSPVHPSAAATLADLRRTQAALRRALGPDAALAAAGVDPWFGPGEVPTQLEAPRYRAMAAYFARRGPDGALMMRCTASTHINLDLGPEGVRTERCALAHLVAPLMTATFSSSPGEGVHCRRARVWQGVDPSRTGFPSATGLEAGLPPEEICARAALDADVLLFRTADGAAVAGEPGFSFRRWIEEGHPRHGRPRPSDLLYHLTTLFFEVRVRGRLELRSPDALPPPWWGVPLVLASGLLYDPAARERALGELSGLCTRLHDLWVRAALDGLGDPEIGRLSERVWEIAVSGAGRLPRGWLPESDLRRAGEFLERFTARGRAPADELREAAELGPAASLSWARGQLCAVEDDAE